MKKTKIRLINNYFAKLVFLPFFCCALCLLSVLFAFNISPKTIISNANSGESESTEKPFSQAYLDYLALDPEEKSSLGYVPDMYDVNTDVLYTFDTYLQSDAIPTEYISYKNKNGLLNTFYNNFQDGQHGELPYHIGSQNGVGICWAFSALTCFENTLYATGTANLDENLNFSELNLAYISQVQNYSSIYTNVAGANFNFAYEVISTEQCPAIEEAEETYNFDYNWANETNATNYYRNNFYGSYTKSIYTAYEAYNYPARSSFSTDSEKLELRNAIKNHIYKYGSVSASIYYGNGGALAYNAFYCYTDSQKPDHAITLVGWDDNITYPGSSITGAYIAQNSHGSNRGQNGFFYIMYDDKYVEENVAGFVRVGKKITGNESTTTYFNLENNELKNQLYLDKYGNYYFKYSTPNRYITNIFQKTETQNQYLSKIKFPTVSKVQDENDNILQNDTTFYVYVIDGISSASSLVNISNLLSSAYNNSSSFSSVGTVGSTGLTLYRVKNKNFTTGDEYLFKTAQTGYYTIDIDSDDYITLSSKYYAVVLQFNNCGVYVQDNYKELQPSQYSFVSLNGTSWDYYKKGSTQTIFPMYVQTGCDLATIDCEVTGVNETYSATSYSISVTVGGGLQEGQYTIYYRASLNDNWSKNQILYKNAGTYIIYYKIEAKYYETREGSATINIAKKDLVILPNPGQSKYYGDNDDLISYEPTGNYEQPVFSGKLSRVAGEDVGNYEITLGTLAIVDATQSVNGLWFLKDNYNLVLSDELVYFNIVKRPIYVEASYTSKTYDGQAGYAGIILYSYSNDLTDRQQVPLFQGQLQVEGGATNVGKYKILQNTLELVDNPDDEFLASNYELVYNLQDNLEKFEILKRDLIITPHQNQSKIYLQPDPYFSYSYSNNVSGEIPYFSGLLSRQSGDDAGDYVILLGSLSLVDNEPFLSSNYQLQLSQTPVYFTITYGTITGCVVENLTFEYDGAYHHLIPLCEDIDGTVVLSSLSGEEGTFQNSNFEYKNVGTYVVYYKFAKNNYVDSEVISATLKINKKDITVTPKTNQSKIYGEEDPVLLFDFSGNVANESPEFAGYLTRENGESANSYLINSGSLALSDNISSGFLSGNYNLIFSNPNETSFEIEARNLIVLPSSMQSKTYGKIDPELTFVVDNLAFNDVPSFEGSLERESGESANNYLIGLGTLEIVDKDNFVARNYNLVFSDTPVYFVINKANITITVDDKESFYGDEIEDFSCVISGDYVEDDDLNIAYFTNISLTGENENIIVSKKGTYIISATASNDNYNIEIENGNYLIKYRIYTVKFFVLDNTSPIKTIEVEHFSLINIDDVPEVSERGYNFNYWKTLNADTSYSKFDIRRQQIIKDTNLVADMELVEYIVALNPNYSGANIISKKYTIHDDDLLLDVIDRRGYVFLGWYENLSDDAQKVSVISSGSTGNRTFFAKWQIITYSITINNNELECTVLFDGEAERDFGSSFEFEVRLSLAYNKSTDMKVFYTTSLDGNEKHYLTKQGNGNFSYKIDSVEDDLEINFEDIFINKYLVSFYVDGNLVYATEKEYGESVVVGNLSDLPPIPEKEHYVNEPAVWSEDSIENISRDYRIDAVYTPDEYVVKFVLEDGMVIETSVLYGEKLDLSKLQDYCGLNLFEYFVFDDSIDNVGENKIINVEVKSNIFYLYYVLAFVGVLILWLVIHVIVKSTRRHKFKWWQYTDVDKNGTKK